ncbi:hypothetical protein ACQBAT_08450 [Ornithinimicrobium sp. Y1847]|uniref:hypothetical protein n=1 Tax=Ornithinimicrobium sp. Y1847 TaxID=3405419 RepID=UPI003B67B642
MPDHELPASVRVALWGTEVLAGRLPLGELTRRALPDLDSSTGLVDRVELWASLGEQVVLVALPRPGDVSGMPRSAPDLLDAATSAQECVYVPGLGGALVPTIEPYGPVGDQGWAATWTPFEADPVPVHRIEALDLGSLELQLRTELAELTDELTAAGAAPFGATAARGRARARRAFAGAWGLPDGMPQRAARVIDLAGTVLTLTDAGLEAVGGSVDATSVTRREGVLRRLQGRAVTALAEATNAAAMHLAYRGGEPH